MSVRYVIGFLTAVFGFAPVAIQAGGVSAGAGAHLPGHPAIDQGDAERLAAALLQSPLTLTRQGATLAVIAAPDTAGDGCIVRLAPPLGESGGASWPLRWADLAWSGRTPGGALRLVFYEPVTRYPSDVVSFVPQDVDRVEAALKRVVANCRDAAGEGAALLTSDPPAAPRSCYFPSVPQLRLFEAVEREGRRIAEARAALTVLSDERPDAELQLTLARSVSSDEADFAAWRGADVAFVYAADGIAQWGFAQAAFARDAVPVAAPHTIAIYGDTRARVTLRTAPPPPDGGPVNLLDDAGAIGMSFRDAQGREITPAVHFAAGPLLAAARRVLSASDWSCAKAGPASSAHLAQ